MDIFRTPFSRSTTGGGVGYSVYNRLYMDATVGIYKGGGGASVLKTSGILFTLKLPNEKTKKGIKTTETSRKIRQKFSPEKINQ